VLLLMLLLVVIVVVVIGQGSIAQGVYCIDTCVTRWIHGGVSIPTAKDTVCDYKVLCYLYMVMATDI
jgi:hypothetical protein